MFTTCQAPAPVHRNLAENLENGAGGQSVCVCGGGRWGGAPRPQERERLALGRSERKGPGTGSHSCEGPEASKVSTWPQGMRWELGAGCLEQPLLATGLREEVPGDQGSGRRRETSMEVTAMVQAREQAGRQREAGHLEVQAGAGGRAPHPVCLGKSTRTASLVEANGRAGGASQSHRVWQEEDGARGFKCGLVTPQRFSTQGK